MQSKVDSAAGMSASVREEFSAFKRWLKARQTRDAGYQEILQQRRFEPCKNWQNEH